MFTRSTITFRTSLDELDELHRIVANRRKGTTMVKVSADVLFKLLVDHAEMSREFSETT